MDCRAFCQFTVVFAAEFLGDFPRTVNVGNNQIAPPLRSKSRLSRRR
jgi:hypothetical protein